MYCTNAYKLYVHMQFELFELTPIICMPTIKKYMTCCSQKTIEENLVRDPGFRHQKSIPHFSPKQLKFITTSFNWDHTYQHGYTMLVSTQHAKKVVFDSPGPVDFAIGIVIFLLNLPNKQVLFFGEIQITEGL